MRDLPDICLEIENSLPLWVGGDLEAAGQRAVEEHLAQCARCAERGAKVRRARAALRQGLSLEVERLGAGFDPWPRIRSQLQAEGVFQNHSGATPETIRAPATRSPGPRILRPAPDRWRRIALAGSLAAAVLVGLLFAWTRLSTEVAETRTPGLSNLEAPGSTPVSAALPSGAVVKPAGLRRLSPNERRLRDSAQVFGLPDEWNSEGMGSQASFERPIETPPR